MTGFAVLLDANILYPAPVRDIFLQFSRLAAWPSGMRGSRIVLIGHHLDTVAIEVDFSRLADTRE